MDLDEMLRVDRFRDMDELITFLSPIRIIVRMQWRRQGGGGSRGTCFAVKPCAPAMPRQLSCSNVVHKRITWLRATDYFEDVDYDVINHFSSVTLDRITHAMTLHYRPTSMTVLPSS